MIASEFILARPGLGHVIAYAYNDFNNPRMYALMLLLLIVATVRQHGAACLGSALGRAARDGKP